MRDSIVFYRSFYEAICELPDEQQLSAIKAILEYGLNGSDDATGTAKAMLMMAQPIIDANNKRYENGKKGGRPKSNQNETEPKPKKNQTETKSEPYVYVYDNVDDKLIKNKVRTSDLAQEFEDVWKMYPRKQGKEKAKTAYIRARQKGTKEDDVRNGIKAYIDHIERNKIEPQYIKMGSTFFANKSWQDDYSANYTRGRPDTMGTERSYDMDELERKLLATN